MKLIRFTLAFVPFMAVSVLSFLLMVGVLAVGSIIIVAALGWSLLVLAGMKLFRLVPKEHPVFFLKKLWLKGVEIPAYILRKTYAVMKHLPVLAGAIADLEHFLKTETINDLFERFFRQERFRHNPALYGDLARVADGNFPKEKYPHLWKNIPLYARTSLWTYSRLCNGWRAEKLTPNLISMELVAGALRQGVAAAVCWTTISLIVWHPGLLIGAAGMQPSPVSEVYIQKDTWTKAERNALNADLKSVQDSVQNARLYTKAATVTGLTMPLDAICSLLFGALVGIGVWRGKIKLSTSSRMHPFNRETPDSLVLFKESVEDRHQLNEALKDQIKQLEYDKTPEVRIGTCTGFAERKNMLHAPRAGAPMILTYESLCSGLGVFGARGSGKTSKVLKPASHELMKRRKIRKQDVSIFATDAKAVLGRQIAAIAREYGFDDDVCEIGGKPGQYGMDLFDGLSPQQAADYLKAVSMQLGGGKSDAFWTDGAMDQGVGLLTVIQAFEHTPAGLAWEEKYDERPYSISALRRIGKEEGSYPLTDYICDSVLRTIQSGRYSAAFAEMINEELIDTIYDVQVEWRQMAEATRSGFLMNLKRTLIAYQRSPIMRRQFGTGKAEKMLSIDDFWTRIVVNDLSSSEYGSAAGIANVFIKLRVYNHASLRQVQGRVDGWMFIIQDEYQSLATATGQSAIATGIFDDSNFWNVCREMKVSGILASQCIPSIISALGEKAANDVLQNLGNHFCLMTEDIVKGGTLDYVAAHAGNVKRVRVIDHDQHESLHALQTETGLNLYDMLEDKPLIPEQITNVAASAFDGIRYCAEAVLPTDVEDTRPLIEEDFRFVTYPSAGLSTAMAGATGPNPEYVSHAQYMNSVGSATHRNEDMHRALLKEVREEPLFKAGDFVNMFSNNKMMAYYQCAGMRFCELVDLNPEEV